MLTMIPPLLIALAFVVIAWWGVCWTIVTLHGARSRKTTWME